MRHSSLPTLSGRRKRKNDKVDSNKAIRMELNPDYFIDYLKVMLQNIFY